jgi:hypothetical protein
MKTLIVLFIVLMPAISYAQAPQKERKSYGYAFTGLFVPASGNVGDPGVHVGVGGEGIFLKGFGVGGEIGYVRSGAFDNGFGLISANPSYHFINATSSRKLVPFVTGGISLFFTGSGSIGGPNFGGGITYWFNDRIGMRLEARDHLPIGSGVAHLPTFRAALTFR